MFNLYKMTFVLFFFIMPALQGQDVAQNFWPHQPKKATTYTQLAEIFYVKEHILKEYNAWWNLPIIPSFLPKPLKIPIFTEAPSNFDITLTAPQYRYHVVKSGENAYRLAQSYQVSIKNLQTWNNLDENYTLKVGQKLIVGKGSEVSGEQSEKLGYVIPSVPVYFYFADITFHLSDKLRENIRQEILFLHQNQTYFESLLQRSKIHLPIIEQCLNMIEIPSDFRYLPIMESNLKAEAVSSSGAMGYWQFKEVSAKEMGLRLDAQIDERLNLTASSFAAGKYLKRSYIVSENWFFSLMSFNLGLTGAKEFFTENYPTYRLTQKFWVLQDDSPRYLIKFLAYHLALQPYIDKPPLASVELLNYTAGSHKTLSEIAQELHISLSELKMYNHWLKTTVIPADKPYYLLIPLKK